MTFLNLKKMVEISLKGVISPFSHCVFKRLELQTRKNKGLFGKGLTPYNESVMLIFHEEFTMLSLMQKLCFQGGCCTEIQSLGLEIIQKIIHSHFYKTLSILRNSC